MACERGRFSTWPGFSNPKLEGLTWRPGWKVSHPRAPGDGRRTNLDDTNRPPCGRRRRSKGPRGRVGAYPSHLLKAGSFSLEWVIWRGAREKRPGVADSGRRIAARAGCPSHPRGVHRPSFDFAPPRSLTGVERVARRGLRSCCCVRLRRSRSPPRFRHQEGAGKPPERALAYENNTNTTSPPGRGGTVHLGRPPHNGPTPHREGETTQAGILRPPWWRPCNPRRGDLSPLLCGRRRRVNRRRPGPFRGAVEDLAEWLRWAAILLPAAVIGGLLLGWFWPF